jgi:hypothetical protein
MRLHTLVLSMIICLCFIGNGFAQIQFGYGSSFNFLKGVDAANLSDDWFKNNFDDFQYGKGTSGTQLSDMRSNYSTIFLRTSFTAQSVKMIKKIKFTSNFDDGFVVWINGVEILRQNAPDIINYKAIATTTHEYNVAYSAKINSLDINLVEGNNLIAVQIFNSSLTSSDIYFDMGIEATPELPQLVIDGDGVSFSKEAGFYSDPFDLTLTSSDPTCNIVYTIDGSNPATSSTKVTTGSSTLIRVDPDITVERGKTPAFVVRACLLKAGYSSTFPKAKTFIFTDKVKTQTDPGGEWPEPYIPEWNETRQCIDYDMASDVVNDNRYKDEVSSALLEIPTISISTDLDNLFGEENGIYVNAENKGTDWERDCSIE